MGSEQSKRETKEKTHDHDFILQGPYLDREKVIQWGKKTLHIIKNNFLKEVQVVIQSMEEVELEIHALQTGQIILSHKEDFSMEGMLCTRKILGSMRFSDVRIYICELQTNGLIGNYGNAGQDRHPDSA